VAGNENFLKEKLEIVDEIEAKTDKN